MYISDEGQEFIKGKPENNCRSSLFLTVLRSHVVHPYAHSVRIDLDRSDSHRMFSVDFCNPHAQHPDLPEKELPFEKMTGLQTQNWHLHGVLLVLGKANNWEKERVKEREAVLGD